MDVSSKIRAAWQWLAAPELWSRRQTAGEAVLAVLIGLLAAGIEDISGGEGWRPAAVALAAAVLSLLRRRLPATVLVITGALTPPLGGFSMLLILVGWSSGRFIAGAGRALGAFTASFALFLSVSLVHSWDRNQALTLAFLNALYFLATTVVPGLASRYWTQRRTLLHTLQERNAQLLRERAMVEGQVRLRERQRIAQDMHDSLGHQLALISVHTGALEVDPELTERQRTAVGVLRNASVTAMHELREVVGILRDGVEAPHPAGAGAADEAARAARGIAGIDGLAHAARVAGHGVELRRSGEPRPLAAAADHAAYRIAQEALTNAYKHAPGARISVELRYEPDSFVVEVVNAAPSGSPGDVVSGGQGLTGLHERARLVGGMVHAGPAPGGGFRVAGVLPYGVVEAASRAEAAPLVDAADDFRQQSRTRPLRDRGRAKGGGPGAAGPVMDWSPGAGGPGLDWTITERELAMAIRGGRTRGEGVAIGCGIAFAALVLLMVAGGFGIYFLMGSMNKGMIDPKEYEAISVGTAESEARDRLPSGDTIWTSGLSSKGPKEPEGSQCLVLMSSATTDTFETEPVFRFCFKDGKLIEKKSYDVRR
ncbi:sensor histidine kinase [Streptomyces purpureus]|uniref:sensor histidine kinase n=1 Tax=Streptomyces purpureus TaxID=1951 RepID=UPI00036103A5|nr:histidine kinase [Streptomyces purpureus]